MAEDIFTSLANAQLVKNRAAFDAAADHSGQSVASSATTSALDALKFAVSSPADARAYAPFLLASGNRYGLSPVLLYAIMWRETIRSKNEGPNSVGPAGDYGLMQINKKANAAWFAKVGDKWSDPETNIDEGAAILAQKFIFFRGKSFYDLKGAPDPRPLTGQPLFLASVAAYNAGEGKVLQALSRPASPDSVTTGGDYATAVLNLAAKRAAVLKDGPLAATANKLVLDLLLASPAEAQDLKEYVRAVRDSIRGFERGSQLALTSRAFHYEQSGAWKVRLGAQSTSEGNNALRSLASAQAPLPLFVANDNLKALTFSWDTGKWG